MRFEWYGPLSWRWRTRLRWPGSGSRSERTRTRASCRTPRCTFETLKRKHVLRLALSKNASRDRFCLKVFHCWNSMGPLNSKSAQLFIKDSSQPFPCTFLTLKKYVASSVFTRIWAWLWARLCCRFSIYQPWTHPCMWHVASCAFVHRPSATGFLPGFRECLFCVGAF